jgi:DNA-binding transcriptional ArsR family regulator
VPHNADEISKLLTAGSHPTRVGIMFAMRELPKPTFKGRGENRKAVTGGISPKELCGLLVNGKFTPGATNLGVVSYHVRELLAKGYIKLLRVEPRRGALKHLYVLTQRGERFAHLVAELADET